MSHSTVEYDYEQVSESGVSITHFWVAESERRRQRGDERPA